MATHQQTLANQRNAQHSTGPTTEAGKQQSRRNALKHGLTGAGVVQSEEDAALIEHRRQTWRKGYVLDGEEQEFQFERMIIASVRMTRAAEEELVVRTQTAYRAQSSWDEDHRRDVERLAQRLARQPSLIAAELATTRQGCEWMLVRWRLLEAAPTWDEAQTQLALDLLGVPPELRSLTRFQDEDRRTCAAREVKRLESHLADALRPLDDEERELAEAGQELTLSRERLRLQRYEAAAAREYYKALSLLSSARARANAGEPVPVTPEPPDVPASPPPPPAPDAQEPAPEPVAHAAAAPRAEETPRFRTLTELGKALTGGATLDEILTQFAYKTNPLEPCTNHIEMGDQAR